MTTGWRLWVKGRCCHSSCLTFGLCFGLQLQLCVLLESSRGLKSQGVFCAELLWQEYRREQVCVCVFGCAGGLFTHLIINSKQHCTWYHCNRLWPRANLMFQQIVFFSVKFKHLNFIPETFGTDFKSSDSVQCLRVCVDRFSLYRIQVWPIMMMMMSHLSTEAAQSGAFIPSSHFWPPLCQLRPPEVKHLRLILSLNVRLCW